MITKYGYTTLGYIAILSFLLIAIAIFLTNPYLRYSLIIIGFLILIFTINFFRDPERKTPTGNNLVISPADGKVISIIKTFDDEFLKSECIRIAIFMSPLNVHVNRIPISGKVEYLKYYPGKYLVAFEEKSSENNERMSTGINSEFGKIRFTQIAGFIARRIVNELKVGQEVKAGERFGMIKFGSRVDVYVPLNTSVKVNEGQKVYSGETILAEFEKIK
ncbi:MAG: phosphatidylserine decarboxylase family protein [Ignavibacteria bacterium]|nr:phosphatidylserine decarboxylase family protein [Ignavibacteria bacterium]